MFSSYIHNSIVKTTHANLLAHMRRIRFGYSNDVHRPSNVFFARTRVYYTLLPHYSLHSHTAWTLAHITHAPLFANSITFVCLKTFRFFFFFLFGVIRLYLVSGERECSVDDLDCHSLRRVRRYRQHHIINSIYILEPNNNERCRTKKYIRNANLFE